TDKHRRADNNDRGADDNDNDSPTPDDDHTRNRSADSASDGSAAHTAADNGPDHAAAADELPKRHVRELVGEHGVPPGPGPVTTSGRDRALRRRHLLVQPASPRDVQPPWRRRRVALTKLVGSRRAADAGAREIWVG